MSEAPDNRRSSPAQTVPPFSPDRFRRQVQLDGALRSGVFAGALALFLALALYQGSSMLGALLMLGAFFGWIALNTVSAKTSRQLPAITALIDSDPAAAEDLLADAIARRPLVRTLRMLLYHRLALIRHRQRRYSESADICQTLLTSHLGPAAVQTRPNLLLMLVEARLECRDMPGAYMALIELYRTRLNLIEALQRLALQTRYEVMCGYDAAAITGWRGKVALAELMPAAPCGVVHAMLATAAAGAGQRDLAGWLNKRARLLCTPRQLDNLHAGGFAADIFDSMLADPSIAPRPIVPPQA